MITQHDYQLGDDLSFQFCYFFSEPRGNHESEMGEDSNEFLPFGYIVRIQFENNTLSFISTKTDYSRRRLWAKLLIHEKENWYRRWTILVNEIVMGTEPKSQGCIIFLGSGFDLHRIMQIYGLVPDLTLLNDWEKRLVKKFEKRDR